MENKMLNADQESIVKNYNFTPSNEKLRFTSIVILSYNQLAYTKLCIESIKKFTPQDSYEIIVVDNNSTDGSVDWLKTQSDFRVIYNDENKGFPAGCNQGIQISKGENILLLNNDTIVTPNWLNNMQKALYSKAQVGGVGAVSNSCSNYQQIDCNYNSIEEMLDFAAKYNISNSELWKLKSKLIGFCFLIKRDVFANVGLLDERFSPGNFEDDDFSYRMICNGYSLLLCQDTFIHHFGSVSFKQNSASFVNVYMENSLKFKEKWGFDAGYSSFVRPEIINLVTDDINKKINVLDVGCGIGATLLEIKNKYKNATLYGIEISPYSGRVAQNICNCIIGNIENEVLSYEENFFDYIILGDVLEHLVDPWKIIYDLKKYLKQDGYIIASIPNIMHISVLRKLLNGSFSYTESGILDKTHLRFFTLAETQNLFNSNEYDIESTKASVVPIDKNDEEFVDTLCKMYGEEFKQQYTAYQYIVKAKPKLDLYVFENDDVYNLRKALLNLDYKKDIEKSLNIIKEFYKINLTSFEFYINYLINNTVINKDYVLNLILDNIKS